jgi:hypothetical protein
MHAVQVLDISQCMTLTDDEIDIICARLLQLHTLNLNGCFMINDSGLARIGMTCYRDRAPRSMPHGASAPHMYTQYVLHAGALGQLRRLDVSHCSLLTDATLAALAACTRLCELRLTSCYRITGVGLCALPAESLTCLVLMHCRAVTTLDALAGLSRLEALSVEACAGLTGEGCAGLARLPSLVSLDVRCCTELTDSLAAALGPLLGRLRALYLGCCPAIGDDFLASLAAANGPLAMLHLRGCVRVTDAGLAHIARLPIERLNLAGLCRITDAGLSHLAPLRLTALSLKCCNSITSPGIAALLRNQAGIEWLDLCMNQQVADDTLAALAYKRRLHTLRLRHSAVTHAGLRALAYGTMDSLRLLNVEQCGALHGAAVLFILSLPVIETVYFAGSGMPDDTTQILRGRGITAFRATIEKYHEVDVW